MWFYLTLLALSMQLSRRTAEKAVSGNISSLAMVWLQQVAAMPFILFTLFFARFYMPTELSSNFWLLMAAYVVCVSIDAFCYFKALSLADVSYVAPLLTLAAVGNIVGAYFILRQTPSLTGISGAIFYYIKQKSIEHLRADKLAAILILILVLVRSVFSNLEVFMIRQANPITFNFYSSLLTIPFVLPLAILVVKSNRSGRYDKYWENVKTGIHTHKWLLTFIGLTYTVNMIATYTAKLTAPNAGYVGAIKSTSVLPMVLIGIIFFKEKIQGLQWGGLLLILGGLFLLAMN